jgi:hypothetical protein
MVASPTNLRDHMIVVTGLCGRENRMKFECRKAGHLLPERVRWRLGGLAKPGSFLGLPRHILFAFPAKKDGTPLYSVIFAIAASCMNDVPS